MQQQCELYAQDKIIKIFFSLARRRKKYFNDFALLYLTFIFALPQNRNNNISTRKQPKVIQIKYLQSGLPLSESEMDCARFFVFEESSVIRPSELAATASNSFSV